MPVYPTWDCQELWEGLASGICQPILAGLAELAAQARFLVVVLPDLYREQYNDAIPSDRNAWLPLVLVMLDCC
jgi:hypothetical protein